MRGQFWIGLAVLLLGLASLVVPIPRTERDGITAGGLSIGIESRHSEKLSPIVGGAMIFVGAGMMVAAKRKG